MIDRAQQVADHDLDLSINSELELIELADLEALIGVEKTMLLNKLSNGEIADELFAFRKSKVLSYVEQKGVTYFSRRNARRGEVRALEDLVSIDQRTLFDVISAFDTYDLAKLIANLDDRAVADKLFSVMTEARRNEVSWVMRRGSSSIRSRSRISSSACWMPCARRSRRRRAPCLSRRHRMLDEEARMDLLTLAGVLLGGAAIVFGFALEGGHFSMLFQFEALVIVLGGTLGAVMIQNTWARFFDAVKQLRLAFVRAREVDRKNLSDLLEWGDRAKLDGLLAFESMDVSGIHPFARRAELLANGVSTAVLEDALQRELDAYERSRLAARAWQQAGGYAPTFGILGSVLAVQVTSHILEPAQLGPGIAVAFIATLYGLAFANLVFLPLYGKLRAQIDSELRFRKLYLDGLLAISRKESPHTIETRLTGDVRGRAVESLA